MCVEVMVRFLSEGGMRPAKIIWADGRAFGVDRVKYIERAPAHVSAVLPVRYTCVVEGKVRSLWFEPEQQRWFVEIPSAE